MFQMTNILKLYKIKTNLVDYNKDTFRKFSKFSHEKDDIFLD